MCADTPIILANDEIEIWLDSATGRIMALRNLGSGLDLIDSVLEAPPWRLEVDGQSAWIERSTSFSYTLDRPSPEGQAVTLRWETELGITLIGRVIVPVAGPALFLTIVAENEGPLAIDKIEYPIISGIGTLGSPSTPSCLAHSQGTGFLFRDPMKTFRPQPDPQQGLRYSPYPEGFSGSTMQFMAYYAEGQGGFYLATRDRGKAAKWLNFYKDVDNAMLAASFMHQAPHVSPGLSLAPDYPVEISALVEGNWYEAAERYKAWAVQQSWTQQGPLADREERARWLAEEVGICTFGVNAAHDRAAWLDAFHDMAGTPVLHILGPNWARAGQDYHNHLPGGDLDDWLPANLAPENLETIRRNGDRWAPFQFDLLCSHDGSRPQPVLQSRQVMPARKYSFDRYLFPFMCPSTPFWRDLHRRRDAQMVADHAPDAVYYDISLNNVLMACRSHHHPHDPGGGQQIADAYAELYADTKAAMAREARRAIPLGTEMVSELVIPFVDYYQARAEASPVSAFEADFWRAWLIEGQVEKIPLFAFVYHEYGPLRMDGWAKLSPEVGDIFFWVASRVALWGGLFELNYEFSALEALDGQVDSPDEHYYRFEPRAYTIDPEKAAFVGEIARARTGWANPYLAYGTMLRPPELDVPHITLDYFMYNCGRDLPHYEERGTITVPSVVCSAWSYRGERTVILFSNLQTEPQTVRLTVDGLRYGLPDAQRIELRTAANEGFLDLGPLDAPRAVTLTLPPRRIIGLELLPPSAG